MNTSLLKYGFAAVCLGLTVQIPAFSAPSDDDFNVTPQPIRSIEEVLHSGESEAPASQNSGQAAEAQVPEAGGTPEGLKPALTQEQENTVNKVQPLRSNEAENVEKGAESSPAASEPEPAAPASSAVRNTSSQAPAVQPGRSSNTVRRSAKTEPRKKSQKKEISFAIVTPEYQSLFDTYAALAESRLSGQPVDKPLMETLEKLAVSEGYPNEDVYIKACRARVKAKGALISGNGELAEKLWKSSQNDLAFLEDWFRKYDRRTTIHGHLESVWMDGRVDAASMAILALCDLNSCHPSPEIRDQVAKLADGIMRSMRPENNRYPYKAHYSFITDEGKPKTYTVPETGEQVAGASMLPDRQYAVLALIKASQLTKNEDLLASAEKEGMGLLAKLALGSVIPYSLAPHPEREASSILASAAAVENLAALKTATNKPVFGILAGCAAINTSKFPDSGSSARAKSLINAILRSNGLSEWIGASDLCHPFEGTTIELEDGKAVDKAFDVHDIKYPGGTEGKFAVVGRDNMFWMRFDVERDDPYYFYLNFLKSNYSGALVSIMMRIDGDQIFRVNLGGATDTPFVDCDLIDGPRQLRQGPHSFGVRFAGLLMKSPAVLDSISVEPAVSRRWIRLSSGKAMLVMHSIADKAVKIRMQELEGAGAAEPVWTILDENGSPAVKQLSSDKRKRAWLEMPAGGTACLEWPGGSIANMPSDEI